MHGQNQEQNEIIMKYWIAIDSWNLMETFVTESLSPYNFYEIRTFGNDLTRYIGKEETYSDIILFADEPVAEYAIQVDEVLLNKSLLKEMTSKNKIKFFSYPTTIYYRRGLVSFRFANNDAIKSFIAKSRIIIEVKTVDKYSDYFFVQTRKGQSHLLFDRSSSIPFDLVNFVQKDNLFNSIKGAIIAYICGKLTKNSIGSQSLILALNTLKNQVAGLNTDIMIGDGILPDFMSIQKSIVEIRDRVKKDSHVQVSSIDVLMHIIDEIYPLSIKRSKEVSERKTSEYKQKIQELKTKEMECSKILDELEERHIFEIKNELQQIKNKEVELGAIEGKKRKFFPKDSWEYNRKKELKAKIKSFEEENKEYRELLHKLKEIRGELSFAMAEGTQYDVSLEALFVRFSDNINNIIKKVKEISINTEQDLTLKNLKCENGKLHLIDRQNNAELRYFNIVMDYIINNPNGKQSTISDNSILRIISDTGKIFKEQNMNPDKKSEIILDTLRKFWLYKNQKSDNFDIPQNMPILQATMSFYIKPRGFDQIDRFMMNKGYQHKELAYMLCGCLMGYAALPKTLTAILYSSEKQNQEKNTEIYLNEIVNCLKSD